ncbi:MAG: sulfatase [Gammaproteobacteria bacterium]|nr:sulfatase [Gammaproteobacteria bacterium]
MKSLICSILLLVTVNSLSLVAREKVTTQTELPNVILIVVDDLNDYQGIFGGHPQAHTPNIDKLANSGVRFVNAQSNVPVCQPSRNSLFTGVYPHDSQDYAWTKQRKHKVLKHNKTLVELFNENAYYTLGSGKLMHNEVTKNWNEWGVNPKHNYGPFPFDGENRIVTANVPEPYRKIGPVDGSYGRLSDGGQTKGNKDWVYGWKKTPFRYINDNDRDLLPDEQHAKWAVDKLEKIADSQLPQPFFMGIGFVRPHTPLYAPDRFFEMFPIDKIELAPWMKNDNNDTHYEDNFPEKMKGLRYYRDLLASYNGDRELAIKHFLQAYLACVAFMDEQVGKVMDALESHEQLNKNTLVIFTADHGWQMGEKNYLFKNSPWEESTRVPLIVRVPGNKTSNVEQPVSLIDIYPTLVDYAKLKGGHKKNAKAGKLGGHSLRAFIEDPATNSWTGPNGALSVVGNFASGSKQWAINKQNYSYRTKDWRYIIYTDGQEELYDHRNDPHEWHNLASEPKNSKLKASLRLEISEIIGEPLAH